MEIVVQKSFRSNNQTFYARASEEMDSMDENKIQAMKNVIDDLVPGDQSVQINTSNHQAPPKPVSQSSAFNVRKQGASQGKSNEPITDKQIALLRKKLQDRNISEKEFCQEHKCNRVEDLLKGDAQWIINELCEQ